MESINDINPERLASLEEFKQAIYLLLNAIEDIRQENQELKQRNQLLSDENNRLKGGNGRPDIKPSKKLPDISSQGKEHGNSVKNKGKDKPAEDQPIKIDREIKIEMDTAQLPADAVFKGYIEYTQQDLRIERSNTLFLFASYYSQSAGRSYRADFPQGASKGHFGAGINSLINILYHYGNVTESKLAGLLEGFGIRISTGSISNLLKEGHQWSVQEQSAILQAGLEQAAPKQMDSTGNRENGVNKVTHIITSPDFSVFYTLGSKSRIDCIGALQGNPGKNLQLQWHDGMEAIWQASKVKKADCAAVMSLLNDTGTQMLGIDVFEDLLKSKLPGIYKKDRIVHILSELMALHYYRQQNGFQPLEVLLTDDAPEYCKIALYHALCWIHDARYYNKLQPGTSVMKNKLETFKAEYWDFYQMLLDYKALPSTGRAEQQQKIIHRFDNLFSTPTCYGALDLCLERTKKNKEKLLRVLDFPDLPLHNNAAELAARRVVRKRDISLHTMTQWGTELRDAFLSIIETAQKLGVSAYQYINDRITQQYNMPSLANIIRNRIAQAF